MKGRKVIIAGSILLLLAVIAAKLIFFRPIKDDYFALNARSLQQVPAGLVVLRPTHFPFLRHANPAYAASPQSRNNFRIVGRNAALTDVLAAAYARDTSRIVLPPDAPKGNFDFLVTVDDQPREHLQAALRKKLGCQAFVELREADVLALKVVNPSQSGFTVSDINAHRGSHYDGSKIHFTSMPASIVADVLNGVLGLAVVDRTGLTKLYDYSFSIPQVAGRTLQDDDRIRTTADNMIKDLGLGLVTEKDVVEVLVARMTPPAPVVADKKRVLLGPLNPGAEEGSDHWYHGTDGNGLLLTDNTDAASGDNDFTIQNTGTNRQDHAEWRSEMFSLGPATNGARPVSFSFDYKLAGPVNEGDNIRVQLRFFDQKTNFIDQKVFWIGASSHDTAMTSYKTIPSGDIVPPAAARVCDVTLSANLYDGDRWSSGIGRFDNIFVTTTPRP